jgi:pimeloyl-ACP methyl ester carboxylesterase
MTQPSGATPEVDTAISTDGVPIKYEVHGDGVPALILIHGWSCDRSYWAEQVGPLSEHYKVVTIDLGGHGESGLGRDDWTIDSFGADVAAVISSLDLQSVVLVGHSMGGDVIFQAARRMPERIRLLVMVDTYKQLGTSRSEEEIDALVAQFEPDFPAVTEQFVRGMFPADAEPALVDRVALDMASAPPAVALSAIRSSFRHAREVPGLIEQLRIPVVAINPDDSPTDMASMAKYGVDVEIMPGVGHFLMMDDPEGFNEVMLSTLAEYSEVL